MKIEIDTMVDSPEYLALLAGLLRGLAKAGFAPVADDDPDEDDGGTIPSFTYVPQEIPTPNLVPTPPLPSVPTRVVPNRPPVSLDLAGDVELDSAGVPWDGRIHSVGKSKVANGTWRLRRGVDPDVVKSAEAEHQFAPVAPPPPPPTSVPSVPAAAVMSFGTLMQRITAQTTSGERSPGEVAAALREAGLPTIPVLATRPDLIGQAAHALGFAL